MPNLQFSVAVRNAMLDQIESTIGTSAVLKIWTGTQPANCGTADSGTQLVNMTLPSDWMGAAAAGVKSLSGTWEDASADDTGTAGHFRIYESTATTCHIQGTCGGPSSGEDMELDNTSIQSGQTVTVTQFDLTAPNA